jgi:hypothetical protein
MASEFRILISALRMALKDPRSVGQHSLAMLLDGGRVRRRLPATPPTARH